MGCAEPTGSGVGAKLSEAKGSRAEALTRLRGWGYLNSSYLSLGQEE